MGLEFSIKNFGLKSNKLSPRYCLSYDNLFAELIRDDSVRNHIIHVQKNENECRDEIALI